MRTNGFAFATQCAFKYPGTVGHDLTVQFITRIIDVPGQLDHTGWTQKLVFILSKRWANGGAIVTCDTPAHNFEVVQILAFNPFRIPWGCIHTFQKQTHRSHTFILMLPVNHQVSDDRKVVQGFKGHFPRGIFSTHESRLTVDLSATRATMAIAAAIIKTKTAIYIFINVSDRIHDGHARLKRELIGLIVRMPILLRIISKDGDSPLFHFNWFPPLGEFL
jgi:hypothetical protein